MDSPEQRRKKKRFVRFQPPYSPKSIYFSPRTIILFFIFVTFLYLLSFRCFSINSSTFRPVLLVSTLSLSSSSSDSVKDYANCNDLRIHDRVLFPDHVLLLLSCKKMNSLIKKNQEFECVYSYYDFDDTAIVKNSVLSMDEYTGFQFIVRCPLPPENYSGVVRLRWRGRSVVELGDGDRLLKGSPGIHSWENLAYATTLDVGTAVVFVKGLNLKHKRESNATQYKCHFGFGKLDKNGGFSLTTRAISAAQEVVRCDLPNSIMKNPDKSQAIRVTIGVTRKPHDHILVPSVAKIFTSEDKRKKRKIKEKYELCVCTMVWNQASPLREWIMYHSWLGVERWFIYDNNSDDGIKEVIEELEVKDYNVTRHLWPWMKTQEAGFSHCLLRAKDECNWVSFIDVDEFFYFPVPTLGFQEFQRENKFGFSGKNSLRNLVSNFSSSKTIAEIRTACHSFGPSGLNSTPSHGVTVGYTCRIRSPERHKSIVRPDAIDVNLLNVVHHFHLRKGFRSFNLHKTTAVINHYKYQVWEVFRAKFFRRVATYVSDWQVRHKKGSKDRAPGLGTEAIEPPNWRLQFCDIWDTGLKDFVLANLVDPETGFLPWERSSL